MQKALIMSLRLVRLMLVLCSLNVFLVIGAWTLTAQPNRVLTGYLGYQVEDPQNFLGESKTIYTLRDETGTRIELTIPSEVLNAAGGHFEVFGQQVQASLSESGVRDGQAIVTSLTRLNQPRWFTVDPTGNEHWDNLLCKFSASASVPPTREFIIELMDNATAGMAKYWEAMGRGTSTFSHTTTQWKTMPSNITTSSGYDAILNACMALHGIDPLQDYQVNTFYNASFGSARGGWDFLGVDKRFTWIPDWAYYGDAGYAVLAHEMGHAYGVPHSNNSDGDTDPYDNPWDLMSNPSVMMPYHDGATYDYDLAKPMNNYYAHQIGLIQNEDVFTYDGNGTQEVIIDHVGLNGTPNYFNAYVPLASGRRYSLETRMQSKGGYQAGFFTTDSQPANGIVLYYVDPNHLRSEYAWLALGTTNANSGTADSLLTVGETFTDATNDVRITILAETTNGFRVAISKLSDPLPFNLLSPASGTTVDSAFPTFQWRPLAGATQYTLTVVSKTTGLTFKYTSVINAASCGETCNFVPSGATWKIKTGATYQWFVKAQDAGGAMLATTSKWPIYFQALPAAVTQTAPAIDATASGMTVFGWLDDGRVGNWTVILKNKAGVVKFKQVYPDGDICNGTTCTVTLDLTNFNKGAYTWRVQAKHPNVLGKKNSPWRALKIQPVVSAMGFRAP